MDKTGMIFGSALIAIILFACPFTAPQEAGAPQPSSPPMNSSPLPVYNPPNASINTSPPQPNASINASLPANATLLDNTERDWALINKANVENACFSQAKKTAAASGYSEMVVSGCACSAQESAGIKSYDCSVSALDGQHPLSIICTKSSRSCSVISQQGNATYTFDQLQALANP
jgi:hypothetical protein